MLISELMKIIFQAYGSARRDASNDTKLTALSMVKKLVFYNYSKFMYHSLARNLSHFNIGNQVPS